jgi:hypothetical protein
MGRFLRNTRPERTACILLAAFSLALVCPQRATAQGSDIILVKKGANKTVARLVPGRPVSLSEKSGASIDGNVDRIDRDTLYVRQYDIRRRPTQWGTSVADTVSTWTVAVHYRDIVTLQKASESFALFRNGMIPLVAGTGYSLLHLVNAGLQKEPVDGRTMAIAGGVALTGLVLNKTHRSYIRLDGRYRLEYIDL